MAGLVPTIHVFVCFQGVDARHKAGHDKRKPALPKEGGSDRLRQPDVTPG